MQLAESKKNFVTQFELEADYDNEEYSSDYDESDDEDWLQDLFNDYYGSQTD